MPSPDITFVFWLWLVLPISWVLDRLLGEPTRFHPLIGFGNWVSVVEEAIYPDNQKANRLQGVLAWFVVMLPLWMLVTFDEIVNDSELMSFSLVGFFISSETVITQVSLSTFILSAAIVYLTIGGKSLVEHAQAVSSPLMQGDIEQARIRLGYIVSRDTSKLNEEEIASATVETVLENGCDAIYGAWFWFLVAGIPGVILYRFTNTLDAMWGYKNDKYLHFGWCAARSDDILNFIPARITAFCYCLSGQFKQGIDSWKAQCGKSKSPNAGPVMAAGAGSLGFSIGGGAVYHGKYEDKPILGTGPKPTAFDIDRACGLLSKAAVYWLIVSALVLLLIAL